MATTFRGGHFTGDGNWQNVWAAVSPLPDESGTPPADPLAGALHGTLTVYICQGSVTQLTYLRIGDTGDPRPLLGAENGQAIATIPVIPGEDAPQIQAPTGVIIDFSLGVLLP